MNEFLAIEEINEEIKDIVSVAESISLTAAKAMRETAQAGIDESGFCLVARELQMFSGKIADAMQSLSELIDWQIEVNAGRHHGVPSRAILSQAHAAPASVSGQAGVDEIEQLIASQVCELQIRMMRTAKQCATGLLIARSDEMEDMYGSAMTPELYRVTQDVEEVIGHITQRVTKLGSRLAGAGLWKEQRLFNNQGCTNECLITEAIFALLPDPDGPEIFSGA